jgi:hypothetical protein
MRGCVIAGACVLLVSCGPDTPALRPDSGEQPPAEASGSFAAFIRSLIGGPGGQQGPVASQPETTDQTPPERSLGIYSRGDDLDPNDLGALAHVTEACGGPWSRDFLNEPLALQNGRVVREGNSLIIGEGRLENPFATLSGDYGPRDMDAWEYHYFGTYADTGLDLVHVQYTEGNGYLLMDRQTLTAVEFQSLPLPSPSGRYFAAASSSEMMFSGIEVAERTQEGLKMVATFESDRYPCGLTWPSETAAMFRELGPAAGPKDGGAWREETRALYRDATIEFRDGKWAYLPAT